ncbi:MAG: histidine kinase [Paludibacter sp.]|nr:histidine kinase [Bacteroidales bacterium]MCM1069296.1 histidine kinase [Prevotella sp.]MCM1353721.1 histidine kinase [Bacteroides sp.]MCM1442211.1 histidine kinase [Muribaculum sp.]MCM1482173.1 histidine kinase [Paludibacter sp.]
MSGKLRNNILQIVCIVFVVLLFRIFYVDIYRNLQQQFDFQTANHLNLFFENAWACILTFGLDTLLVLRVSKKVSYVDNSSRRLWIDIGIVCMVSLCGLIPLHLHDALASNFGIVERWSICFSYLTLLFINVVYVSVLDLLTFFRQSRSRLQDEKNGRTQAEYHYSLLKAQLNPHFLFNSLNILDYLVQNNEKERAGEFIRKLASVYRYLLHIEEQDFVNVQTERDFIEMYVDLLRERFPEGLKLHIQIPDEYLSRSIVPLGLQILIENAIKHNVVSSSRPLYISIGIENDMLFVSNNIQPKLSGSNNGIGLKNLEEQYRVLTDKHIMVEETEMDYTVRLPLI